MIQPFHSFQAIYVQEQHNDLCTWLERSRTAADNLPVDRVGHSIIRLAYQPF